MSSRRSLEQQRATAEAVEERLSGRRGKRQRDEERLRQRHRERGGWLIDYN